MELEVEAFLAERAGLKLADGRVRLVRHGYGPEREVQTGIGAVSVARPKVQDRGSGEAEHLGGVGIVRLSSAAMVSGH